LCPSTLQQIGKPLRPPPHLRIRAGAFRHPAGGFLPPTQDDKKFNLQPQTDGQAERINQILEDMLRACAIDYNKN
jgi:hypothetical protein